MGKLSQDSQRSFRVSSLAPPEVYRLASLASTAASDINTGFKKNSVLWFLTKLMTPIMLFRYLY
jgi:hypothetical protein